MARCRCTARMILAKYSTWKKVMVVDTAPISAEYWDLPELFPPKLRLTVYQQKAEVLVMDREASIVIQYPSRSPIYKLHSTEYWWIITLHHILAGYMTVLSQKVIEISEKSAHAAQASIFNVLSLYLQITPRDCFKVYMITVKIHLKYS